VRKGLVKLHQRLLRDTLGQVQHDNLVAYVSSLLPPTAAKILDIGCGNGMFARKLMSAKPGLQITGIEVTSQPNCLIDCHQYDGNLVPFDDDAFDYAMLINVLHHADDPLRTLSEANRVAKRGILLKDHYANTSFDFYTLVIMEWIGNTFSNISQPYNFFSEAQWKEMFQKLNLATERLLTRFRSYNAVVDVFCGRNLHFIALLSDEEKTPRASSIP
jgi:ubiquinone/menaquinone biosynthesis C-methylase UbiE